MGDADARSRPDTVAEAMAKFQGTWRQIAHEKDAVADPPERLGLTEPAPAILLADHEVQRDAVPQPDAGPRDRGQRGEVGDHAGLHVAGTPAVHPAAGDRRPERVRAPLRPVTGRDPARGIHRRNRRGRFPRPGNRSLPWIGRRPALRSCLFAISVF